MRDPDFDPARFDLGDPVAEVVLRSDAATRALGAALAEHLEPGDFLGLVGTLGAGKTTLVQGLTRVTAPHVHTTSPTYTLVNLYEGSPPVVHIDLYRLENFDDLESIGYWDHVESGRAISCVEWFSLIPGSWPEQGGVLELTPIEQGQARSVRAWASDDAIAARLRRAFASV